MFASVVLLLVSALAAQAGENTGHNYEGSFSTVTKIGTELHRAIDKAKRDAISAEPVLLAGHAAPCVAPARITVDGTARNVVQVSSGFVALINGLAHAKAIDETEPGYFKSYAAKLGSALDGIIPSAGADLAESKAWSFDVVNHQISLFNQMTGAMIAIDMAHHQLGHYKKYAAQLTAAGGQPSAINNVLTEKEWRQAVLAGAKNALDCGLGVDGLRTLFTAFEAMPQRPVWAAYFIHAKADVTKLNRELERLENDFFLVDK
jgi:hypothetical protein